jgi:hypothetical protein
MAGSGYPWPGYFLKELSWLMLHGYGSSLIPTLPVLLLV